MFALNFRFKFFELSNRSSSNAQIAREKYLRLDVFIAGDLVRGIDFVLIFDFYL